MGISELKFLDGARELLDFIIAETCERVVCDSDLNGKQESHCDGNCTYQTIHKFHIVYLSELYVVRPYLGDALANMKELVRVLLKGYNIQ